MLDTPTVLAEELTEITSARARTSPPPPAATGEKPIDFGADSERGAAADKDLFGLAFSGGGIRSATFNLGVIQALAELKLLAEADYLSTVSGGGYIGAWLTAWAHRVGGIENVQELLRKSVQKPRDRGNGSEATLPRGTATSSTPTAEPKALEQEQQPVWWLREHSNYLTPRLGLFGADTWSAISIYLRNLILNLTILVGALLAVLLLPRLLAQGFSWLAGADGLAGWLALGFLLVATVLTGINLRFVRGAPHFGQTTLAAEQSAQRVWLQR